MFGNVPRRRFLAGAATVLAGAVPYPAAAEAAAAALARIEAASGGRLGVAVRDAQGTLRLGHRAAERFPMCSTFKLLAASALLTRVDAGREDLDRRVRFTAREVVDYSPVTQGRTGGAGMTLAELCEAAMTQSDNTAGNLILAAIGGPEAVTAYARTIGDAATRLDRTETALNEAAPGDPRDTTTPAAMAADLHALVLGTRLSAPSRDRLAGWLLANRTGAAKLRAGVPADWRVGDKTGGGGHGSTNDIAVLWPPARPPLVACVYLTGTEAPFAERNAAIAAVGRLLAGGV